MAEEEEEETRVCGRCKSEVAESNFTLHESHCSRFLCVCDVCDESVPKSELQKHKDEQHTKVRCSKCKKKMERRFIAEHEEQECPSRLQLCVFCDLTLPWTELQEHAVACGSRTEPCPDCGRYVRLSEQREHEKTCLYLDSELDHNEPRALSGARGAQGGGKTKTTRKFKQMCKICLESIPIEEIQKHEMRCTAAPLWNLEDSDSDSDSDSDHETPQASGLDFSKLRLKNVPQTDEEQTEHSTCPHCQLVLPWATLRWHVEKCKVHMCLKHRETTAQS